MLCFSGTIELRNKIHCFRKKRMTIESIAALREVIGEPHPITASKKTSVLTEEGINFIARAPLVIMTTVSSDYGLDASPKGDAPGFVQVVDKQTVLVPDRPGNKLADGHLNVLQTGRVGLIFLVPNARETLRLSGSATLTAEPALLENCAARGKPAVLVTRVSIETCFFHCGKALIRSDLWKPETWDVPTRVSFGRMLAKANGGDDQLAEAIDQNIADDYTNNL
jgi:PPOX class probable FMN-dependent enzyme